MGTSPFQIFHQEQHFLQLQIFVQQLLLQQQKPYKTYDSYDDGYDAIYDDDDYDEDRYDSDPDYAAGVDDAMDELDW